MTDFQVGDYVQAQIGSDSPIKGTIIEINENSSYPYEIRADSEFNGGSGGYAKAELTPLEIEQIGFF